jgi:GSH-dependent disulfide-bond oxidoreductase
MADYVLYTHNTPNGFKVSIALEELGLPYEVRRVNVHAGEQFLPDFVALNPNAKVPVLTDTKAGITLAESNAILVYLAEKVGALLPSDLAGRTKARELLFFQAASIGPMFGQRAHFSMFAPEASPYAIRRYNAEGERLFGVLERMLDGRTTFLADYSIVDIAVFGWVHTATAMGFGIEGYPNLRRWMELISARPAVQRGINIPGPLPTFPNRRTA